MQVFKDISYGSHERHKLDILFPHKPKSDRGVLLFIHGGGWSSGDKSVHFNDAEYFCRKGFITASMNYRYVDESINAFDELDDIGQCLECIKSLCLENGFCVGSVALTGGSAGAQLALMYAYTRKDVSPLSIEAVFAYCPPVKCYAEDFLLGISGEFEDWKYGILSHCCGERLTKADFTKEHQQRALRKISPMEYVTEDCAPTMVFCGKNDELVPISHIYEFVELLGSKNIVNELLIYENSGHAMDKDEKTSQKAKDIIEDKLHRYF